MKRWSGHEPIPVIIVGFGRMGRRHAETFARMPEYSVRGVVDTNPACGPIAAGMGLTWHPEIRRVPGGAHLAVIAVPSTRHAQAFGEIAALGMHCLIEKPVGAHLAELETIADTASQAGLQVFAGYCERFNAVMLEVDEALRLFPRRPPQEIQIRRMSSVALGRTFDIDVLYDLVSHDVDWMIRTMGEEPVAASIETAGYHAGRLEEVQCAFHFPRGIRVQLAASRIAASSERSITVAGDDGRSAIFHLNQSTRTRTREDPLTAQARALASALKGEDSAIARVQDALRVQRLLNRLAASLPRAATTTTRIAHAG